MALICSTFIKILEVYSYYYSFISILQFIYLVYISLVRWTLEQKVQVTAWLQISQHEVELHYVCYAITSNRLKICHAKGAAHFLVGSIQRRLLTAFREWPFLRKHF